MKKLTLLLLLVTIYPAIRLDAQKDAERLNFYDGEFFLSDESYQDALLSYKKVYDAGYQDNANVNYRIGMCYLNIEGEKAEAIPYLLKAVTNISESYREGNFKEESAAPDALLFLGNAYRIDNQLDKAIETYGEYLDRFKKGSEKERLYATQEIEACRRAKDAIMNPVNIKTDNLGNTYNTSMNNFNAVVSMNDSVMAYMTERKFYDAVYFSRKVNGKWTNPVNITPQIQSDGDQSVCSLSADGKTMFLVKISNFDSDILVSDYDQQTWSKSRNIGKPVNSKFFESHASLSPDGRKLYFTSNRSGGEGEMDIYVSEMTASGDWGEPVNLGKNINTPLNEESPFLTADGKRLFFSSQGHETIGGYDIFYSTLNEDGSWSKPVPEPYPLNTTDDDVFFFPLDDGEKGYLTRYQSDGLGSGDIYEIQINPVPETAGLNKAEQDVVKDIPQVKETREMENAIPDISENPANEPVTEEPVEEKPDTQNIPVVEAVSPEKPAPAEEPVPMAAYHVKPIFFDFDSYALSGNAKQKLEDIKALMQEYPDITLEVRGHTDAIGSETYNQALSEKRARSAIQYLANQGIPSGRMQFKGFSEDQPVALNRTPDGRDSSEGRQLNRRVEFRITGSEKGRIIIETVNVPDNLKIQ